jgi:hypothetical protein
MTAEPSAKEIRQDSREALRQIIISDDENTTIVRGKGKEKGDSIR